METQRPTLTEPSFTSTHVVRIIECLPCPLCRAPLVRKDLQATARPSREQPCQFARMENGGCCHRHDRLRAF